LVNNDPYVGGWMIKLEVSDLKEVEALLDAAAYQNLVH